VIFDLSIGTMVGARSNKGVLRYWKKGANVTVLIGVASLLIMFVYCHLTWCEKFSTLLRLFILPTSLPAKTPPPLLSLLLCPRLCQFLSHGQVPPSSIPTSNFLQVVTAHAPHSIACFLCPAVSLCSLHWKLMFLSQQLSSCVPTSLFQRLPPHTFHSSTAHQVLTHPLAAVF